MHPWVPSRTIHSNQDMETTEMSINRWMDKDVVHISHGILFNHDNLEGWDGGGWEGVQEGGDICILVADSCGYTAEINTIF